MAKLKTDWILFLTILVMVGFGLVMAYSASSAVALVRYAKLNYPPYHFIVRQLGWAAVSLVVLMYLKRADYRRLNTPTWAFSGLGVVLALLVIVWFADSRAHRWFNISGLTFQPSEFAKPAIIVFLAYFLSRRSQIINDRYTLRQAFVAVALLAVLVVVGDLGTAMVPVITALVVFWVAGLEKKYMVRVMLVGVALFAVAVLSKPVRMMRVITYVDPEFSLIDKIDTQGWIRSYVKGATNPRQKGNYQAQQSTIAVGSGGVLGAGLMQGAQKEGFLPDIQTDFIYANIAEELGLWGATAVLVGFILILWRGVRLFLVAREDFGKYLALGVTVAIVVQAFLNMSVVLNMAPTKGFPLPLFSIGGSSLLSTLTCLGMLLSVSEHEG